MFESIENMTFNGIDLASVFTDEDKGAYFVVNSVQGRGVLGMENTLINIGGMDGAHPSSTHTPPRYLDVDITLKGESFEDLRKRIERLNELLYTGDESVPISFADESDRTYYGKLDDVSYLIEKSKIYQATLTFICPDPYKYGPLRTAEFPAEIATITNNGTAPTYPTFRATVKESITHLDIVTDDAYMLIGEPYEVDETPFEEETLILHDTMATLTGWTNATYVDNGRITGQMATDGRSFYASAYGTVVEPHVWQGPSVKKSLSQQLQDFRAEILIEQLNVGYDAGMLEIYFLDAANRTVAKIGMEDRWVGLDKNYGKFQLGPIDDRYSEGVEADNIVGWNNFKGILRVERIGELWRPYWAIIDSRGNHIARKSTVKYIDTSRKYQAPIAQIQVALRKFPGRVATNQRVNDIKVWRINKPEDYQIPYIAHLGDTIEIDHAKSRILINGEDRKDLKDFGASFFALKKGENVIQISPFDSVDVNVEWREAFL